MTPRQTNVGHGRQPSDVTEREPYFYAVQAPRPAETAPRQPLAQAVR